MHKLHLLIVFLCSGTKYRHNTQPFSTTLLEYGADANAVTRQGIAPVHLASQEGHVDMVSLLLTRNANVNLSNKASLHLFIYFCTQEKIW
uniref:Ankyrin repeat protein n=1 Tax=Chelonoidis abingdonii TaxID=106734 RepID=A0A8C0GA82_CHEAB